MTIKTEEIYEALKPVQDPELNRSIVDLGMVKSVSVDKRPGNCRNPTHYCRMPAQSKN